MSGKLLNRRGIGIILMLVLVALASSLLFTAEADMHQHKETIIRVVEEGFNEGKLEVVDELFAENYEADNYMGEKGNRESFKAYIAAVRGAMPDYHAEVDMFVTEGDWIAFRFTSEGTFENELALFPGLPPTGETVENLVHIFVRFDEDGRLVEEWDLIDNINWLTDLGVLPPMGE